MHGSVSRLPIARGRSPAAPVPRPTAGAAMQVRNILPLPEWRKAVRGPAAPLL